MKDISLLLPKVQEMTNHFISVCKDRGYTVIITSTLRTEKEQNALYAQGRTTPGDVVTNAKFGDSLHNYGVAIDFAPVDNNGNIPWSNKALFTTIGEIGESCGFEWGGRWVSFLDLPHLQYTAGYSLQDFKSGKVDKSKFGGSKHGHVEEFITALNKFQIAEGISPAPIIGPKTTGVLKKYGLIKL